MNQENDNQSTCRDYSRYLKSRGLKVTPPRVRILQLFENSPTRHLSADDVYKLLQENQSDISFATIYRVLTQFEQAGLLIRHHFETGKAVFELNDSQLHDHLVCIHCGRVVEFFDPEIKKRQAQIAKKNGFQICAHSIYFYAHCLDCSKNNPESHDSPLKTLQINENTDADFPKKSPNIK